MALWGRRASVFVFVICSVVAVSPADGFTSVSAALVTAFILLLRGRCVCVCVCVVLQLLLTCAGVSSTFLKIKAY